MSEELIAIADAVVAELNAEGKPWTGSFPNPAERAWAPVFELELLSTLRVAVIPTDEESDPASRAQSRDEVTVDIGFEKKAPTTRAGIDELVTLAGKVYTYFKQPRQLSARSSAVVMKTERLAPDTMELREGKFLAVVRLHITEMTAF